MVPRASGTLTLPRNERLRQADEIQALFQRGKRVERRTCLFLWLPAERGRKVGFAVSRQLRGAVRRNRVKRRLREAYRRQGRGIPAGAHMVVIGRPSAEAAAFREILADVEQALAAVAARSRHPGARQ